MALTKIHHIFCCKQNTQETEFNKFLMAVHVSNIEELQYYNVTVIYNKECKEFNVHEIMEGKLDHVQRVYWFDTRGKKAEGNFSLYTAYYK